MTQTDMAMLALIAGLLLFAGIKHLIEAGPDAIVPDPVVAVAYEPVIQCHGGDLPARPDGLASLKAEIARTPGRHRAEATLDEIAATIAAGRAELVGAVPDWTQTDEHFFAWGSFFEREEAGVR